MASTQGWADPADVQVAVDEWTADVLFCRAYGHSWRPLTVTHDRAGYLVIQRCSRCRNKREQIMDHDGYVQSWKMRYDHAGYLLAKGVGRMSQEGKAIVRLGVLRTLTIVEAAEDEEAAS